MLVRMCCQKTAGIIKADSSGCDAASAAFLYTGTPVLSMLPSFPVRNLQKRNKRRL